MKTNGDQWRTGLPTYHKVIYREVWPGIDVEYSGTGQQLKTTYIVKPGADPKRIRLAYRGVTKLALADNGQLNIHTPKQVLTEDTPYSYQEINGKRVEVRSAYRLRRHASRTTGAFHYGFQVGKYDRSQPLIIDPVIVVYAGYIGGSGGDSGGGIAVDSAGNAYVTGHTFSDQATFPETVGPDLSYNGGFEGDAFVAKVRADGTGLVYAGYIGGIRGEIGNGIAVDSAGNAYVTGYVDSDQVTFPVKGGPDLIHNGGTDAFVAKVRADGMGLVYAGYIGGSGTDISSGIAVDSAGNAYVTGQADSAQATFPVKRGPDLTHNGDFDAFVAKIGGLPLAGIGVFRTTAPNAGRWYLDANRSGLLNICTIDKCQGPFGVSTDIPVVGQWNGVATPRLGTFTPTTRVWRLDLNGNGVWNGVPTDRQVVFGIAGDKPVVGDWTGNGITRIGVFRQSNGMWYLDKDNDGLLEACTIDLCQGPFGLIGDRPVAGDWSGTGKTKIGVYRPSNNRWYIDYTGDGKWNGVPTDKLWAFGVATDQQVVGDWTGDGKAKPGVFRQSNGLWYLDADGNGVWNVGDLVRGPFGLATDKAVAGAW